MMLDVKKEQKNIEKLMQELHEQFLEMSQIKTRFDTEKFTVGKEGNFIASQFHFLMRQYRFAMEEIRRMLIDYEEAKRELDLLRKEKDRREKGSGYRTSSSETKKRLASIEHLDLEMMRQENRIKALEIDIYGKLMVINDFEDMRKALIERNGGRPITNEQFQDEQPEYYTWFISKRILHQMLANRLGISEGIIDAEYMASQVPLLESSKMQIPRLFNDLSLDVKKVVEFSSIPFSSGKRIERG